MSPCLFLPLSSPLLRVPLLPPLPLPHFCADCSFASSSPWVPVVIEKSPASETAFHKSRQSRQDAPAGKIQQQKDGPAAGGWPYPGGLGARSARVFVCVCLAPAPREHAKPPGGSLRAPAPLPGGFDASPCLCKYCQQPGSAWKMMQCLGKWERASSSRLLAGMPSLVSAECHAFAIGCTEGFFCAA